MIVSIFSKLTGLSSNGNSFIILQIEEVENHEAHKFKTSDLESDIHWDKNILFKIIVLSEYYSNHTYESYSWYFFVSSKRAFLMIELINIMCEFKGFPFV